ncbi:hypothetical protein L211DRAFT_845760 [Terfezia boudieri ATCC MYA-4762]|uniref:NB-ARC domain-containing protein n=1 Tax=Terfezia boudieri ATCC MYA-4762 TaxID=1051890 RepID=A0A3N4M114_9PEZI|nr:hypothetical protein L211DRAFT_845760 [Terfezia boudieri ATCC MYA-4762]
MDPASLTVGVVSLAVQLAKAATDYYKIFDDMSDEAMVCITGKYELASFDIEEYIPACNHGTVIITSRRRDLQQGRRGFEVQQMKPIEAIQLLLKACAMPKFEDLISSAEELGYLPLALDQAGAYIHMAQYSLGQYLEDYRTNANYLLSKGWKGGKQDKSVFATWEISFNTIQQKSPKGSQVTINLRVS